MTDFTADTILDQIDRRLSGMAASRNAVEQQLLITEAVMWLTLLGDMTVGRQATESFSPTNRLQLKGVRHARNKGLHHAIHLSDPSDAYTDRYTEMYAVPVWSELPSPLKGHEDQETAYVEEVLGRSVLDTVLELTAAFRAACR